MYFKIFFNLSTNEEELDDQRIESLNSGLPSQPLAGWIAMENYFYFMLHKFNRKLF